MTRISATSGQEPSTVPETQIEGSQRDRAYSELRRLLLLQQVREGQRLREPEWAQRLGVNRVALREAFARLEAEGFLEKGPKTGYFVPSLSDQELLEILEVRAALECAAIEKVCAGGPPAPEAIAPVLQVCEELEQLIRIGYLLSVSEADRRFHESLVALSGNKRLMKLYGNAPLPMLHGRVSSGTKWEAESRATLAEHRSIVKAIQKGDAKRAQALLRQHLYGPYLHDVLKQSPK
jgi:DNA-binding GntR family transcriptional regulator